MTSDWERGYDAGYRAAHRTDVRDITSDRGRSAPTPEAKKKRKPNAYNKRYGAAFKRLASKYKNKNGSWKKNGFKRAAAAARKEAKR